MFRVHEFNPASAVENAYFRIQQERMVGVPILNAALSVEAVDFQRWQGHWLGVVVTPWCLSALLVPGQEGNWETPGDNQRRFVKFPSGDFAFLFSDEPEVGEFQSCALISPMGQFTAQSQAVLTARAALLALLHPVELVADKPQVKASTTDGVLKSPDEIIADAPSSLSRRRLFGLGRKPG